MKIQEIRELIRLIDQSSISEFEFEQDGAIVKLKKDHGVATAVVAQPMTQAPVAVLEPQQPVVEPKEEVVKSSKPQVDESLVKITSPMVGTFYASPSPQDPPYIKIGDRVTKDSIVCIVEAMKLFNEIEAEISGEVVEVLVESGQLVEYGQPLFLVRA